jgi:hypothetical protein
MSFFRASETLGVTVREVTEGFKTLALLVALVL